MENWTLIYQARWYVWIPISIYGVFVELFMAIIGLGSLGYGIAALLGVVSVPVDKTMPAWQSYGLFSLELLFAAWLGWNGMRGTRACFLAVFTPPLVYEGILDQATTETRRGSNTAYSVRVFKAGDKSWEISKHKFDHALHGSQVTAGRHVRIQYRRGTEEITQLWVKRKIERTRRN